MKPRTLSSLVALAMLLSPSLPAAESTLPPAELEQLIKEIAPYQSGANLQPLRRMENLVRQSTSLPALRVQLEKSLVRLLGSEASFEAKRFACQQLGLIGSEACLPALAELLKSDETAGMACLALSTLPSSKANALLCTALPDSPGAGTARLQIINALGNRRVSEAVPSLINMAQHSLPAVAAECITALGKIASPAACEALATFRRDQNPALAGPAALASLNAAALLASDPDTARKHAAVILAIQDELLRPPYPAYIRRAALEGSLQTDPKREERIFNVLHGNDPALKPVAIAAVRTLKSRSASARFAAELPDLTPAEQVLLIQALASRGDAAARSALVASLAGPEPAVRQAAMTALGNLAEPSAVAPLLKTLANPKSPEERAQVEQVLVSMQGGAKIDKAILSEFKNASTEQQLVLVSILAKREAVSAVPLLLKQSSNPALAKAAFTGLASLAPAEEAPALLETLVNLQVPEARSEAESAAAQALGKASPARGCALVCKNLARAKDLETRCSLLRLLSACPDARGLEQIKSACADKEARIRQVAIRTLTDWPDLAAWDSLAAIYAQPENESQRVLALRALVRLAGEANAKVDSKLLDNYRQLLAGAKNDNDHKLILSALAGAAHPQALGLVSPLLDNAGVRAEAEWAIKKIAESIKTQYPKEAQEALKKLQKAQ